MPRPRSENYEDVKDQILDAVATLFAKKGFLNTNIAEIGAACNASKSRASARRAPRSAHGAPAEARVRTVDAEALQAPRAVASSALDTVRCLRLHDGASQRARGEPIVHATDDLEIARRFMADEPYSRNGLFRLITYRRLRQFIPHPVEVDFLAEELARERVRLGR